MAVDDLLGTGLVQDPGAVPLVVAVAGHRDPRPQDIQILRERFCSLIKELLETLPNTPLLMLNGLAEGMDTEAAELFLKLISEHKQRHPHGPQHQLVGVLPKLRHLYLEEDFENGSAGKARLVALLSRCDAVLDGDNCSELATSLHDTAEKGDAWDNRCYGRQGIFLVRHCYLLIAFSNGLDSGKIGGTSQTVAMQRGEVYPLFLHVDEVIAAREPGVVVEITTPRVSDQEPFCPVGHVRYWSENLDGSRINSNALASLEKSSLQELIKTDGCIPTRIEAINSQLGDFPPANVYNTGVQASLWRYADHSANISKSDYVRLCRGVMIASILIGLGTSQQEWQAVGLLVVLAAVLSFPKLQQGPKLRFIQWRCLAESLLIADFWCAAGVQGDTADLFHSQTSQNFGWIRTILRARRVQLMALQADPDNRSPLPEAIECCRRWINGQEEWLARAISRQQKWDQKYALIGSLSFFMALAMGVAFWLFGHELIDELWPETLIGIAVASYGYRELMGYGDTNARYGRSRSQFARAREALALTRPTPNEPDMLAVRQRLVVEAVGREKIDELNDWVGDQLQRVYKPAG